MSIESTGAKADDHGLAEAINTIDPTFVHAMMGRTLAQLDLGQQAQQVSQNEQIKQFAEELGQDVSNMNKQLQQVAQQQGLRDVPTTTGPESPYFCASCSGLQGTTWDQQYITYQVYELPRMVNDLTYLGNNTTSPAVRTWATSWSPYFSHNMSGMSGFGSGYGSYYPYSTYYPYSSCGYSGSCYYPTYYPRTVAYYPVRYQPVYYPTYYPYGVSYYYPNYRTSYYPYGTVYYRTTTVVYPSYGTTYYPYGTCYSGGCNYRAALFTSVMDGAPQAAD